MQLSKHTIFGPIKDSQNFFLVNILNGSADLLGSAEALRYQRVANGDSSDTAFISELTEKGYWVDEKAENSLYRTKYLDFIDSRDTDEIQLFFVPNYACNFACTYCFQDEYTNPALGCTEEIVDAFFRYIETNLAGRRKYITVFGGEPLLPGERQKEIIRYLIDKSNNAGLDLCFVTNGYTLSDYIDILKQGRIREIQVTLDGTAEIHDKRRFLKGYKPTFETIIKGIDACLSNQMMVNLRMVLDKENIGNLPELARFAIDKGWTSSPFFKTQIGRNYELHHCQSAHDRLFTRISMYEHIYEQVKQHPYITEFYKPAYSVAKFLSENGELPDPLFDACPACKTEWAFDYTGKIYPCTATVGKDDEALGTFFPDTVLYDKIVSEWEKRDVMAIAECRDCSLQLACGGGCGSIAKNRTGNVCSSDCRPVNELLQLGFAAYLNENN
jgi:uncharacterized protein